MTGVSAQILSAAIYCGVSEIAIHSLRSNWPGARREGGSVSAAIIDRLSNEAPGQFQRNPEGGMSFGRRRRCSLLTDPLGICSSLAPSLPPKSIAANVELFRRHHTSEGDGFGLRRRTGAGNGRQ